MYIYVLYRIWESIFENFWKNYKFTIFKYYKFTLWACVIYQIILSLEIDNKNFFLNSDNIDVLEYASFSFALIFIFVFYL